MAACYHGVPTRPGLHSAAMASRSIAVFVSPHGFGHAARAAAVLSALRARDPELRFELFTTVPEWFFAESLAGGYRYHPEACDVGLAQSTAVEVDPAETVRRLADVLPPSRARIERLAGRLGELGCCLVVCDIAPLGLAAARRAGLPSVLVENFTWDLIYRAYLDRAPGLAAAIEASRELAAAATVRVQTEPVCAPFPGALWVAPVSRTPRTPGSRVRRRLGIADDLAMVLVTMGGIGWRHDGLGALERRQRAVFVVPGAAERPERRGSLLALPHRSGHFHPDLVAASDLVVGKLGYSTVAEAVHSGARLLYLPRPDFPESPVLESFVRRHLPAAATSVSELASGSWLDRMDRLLEEPRPACCSPQRRCGRGARDPRSPVESNDGRAARG